MYVTGSTNNSYLVSYHLVNRKDMNLIDLCNTYSNKYFIILCREEM